MQTFTRDDLKNTLAPELTASELIALISKISKNDEEMGPVQHYKFDVDREIIFGGKTNEEKSYIDMYFNNGRHYVEFNRKSISSGSKLGRSPLAVIVHHRKENDNIYSRRSLGESLRFIIFPYADGRLDVHRYGNIIKVKIPAEIGVKYGVSNGSDASVTVARKESNKMRRDLSHIDDFTISSTLSCIIDWDGVYNNGIEVRCDSDGLDWFRREQSAMLDVLYALACNVDNFLISDTSNSDLEAILMLKQC
jgi:hypothetical protein